MKKISRFYTRKQNKIILIVILFLISLVTLFSNENCNVSFTAVNDLDDQAAKLDHPNNKIKRPNIVLIMSDDMGYSDIGAFGGEIDTPALDELALNGVRFTQFYNTARCCPTRASLMTGLYPHQTGIGHMTNPPENKTDHDVGLPGYRGFLNRSNITLAELLKSAGYTTLMTGKWHLGMSQKNQWPLQRGFDRFYGILAGASNFFKPKYPRHISLNNEEIEIQDDEFYTTDAFTDYAKKFIGETTSKEKDKPFFLYLAYTAPHWPLQAPKAEIDKYRNRYHQGWTQLRDERYQRMIDLGLIEDEWELSQDDAIDWDGLSEKKQEEMALRRAIYAAQIDKMDQNIGELVSYLKDIGEFDNTIILFLNDNGACAEGGMLGGGPAENLESKEGYFLTYGQAWANSSNTPFRKYKHWLHEGGISTPLIVHWPEGIKSKQRGKIINHYGFLPDIMATFVELANAKYPKTYQGNNIHSIVGKSLMPLIEGKNKPIHTEPIFWEHEGNKAVRLGNYKLVMDWGAKQQKEWELYDMQQDRSETNNIADQYPEKVKELSGLWERWAEVNYVESWDVILKKMREKR
ncbi:arylsulfatase [Aestuariibaculum marinum]|uniref:Arylsulfatase n=1 Tax=Aestuariibaculum marinum TaxID=2683592 RepID=A0A8J6Q023_9FLAO|nr:arylsulfatase [Aestuariibaculum marinum]MBD0825181.1 arylsulfatase [Aestuariibaculum marinum]